MSWSAMERSRAEVVAPGTAESGSRTAFAAAYMLHPYLGFVRRWDPAVPGEHHGFVGDGRMFEKRSPATLRVGVFGGSVAAQMVDQAGGALAEELKRIPRFRGREVVLLPVALGGYKQPQQMLALAYLQSLGAQFDMVIELDGFNEIVWSGGNNAATGIFPYFPRSWQALALAGDAEHLTLMGEVSYLRTRRTVWARGFGWGLPRRSFFGGLLWRTGDAFYERRIQRRLQVLARAEGGTLSAQGKGPQRTYAGSGALLDDLADHWMRSSIAMRQLLEGTDTLYYHFLQPNQYDPGSKPMGEAERAATLSRQPDIAPWVPPGYDALRRRAPALRAGGVRFHDLTRVFASVPEPLYADRCCHLTPKGYALLARAIADEIARDDDDIAPRLR